jgi:uncharacterized protein YkwD
MTSTRRPTLLVAVGLAVTLLCSLFLGSGAAQARTRTRTSTERSMAAAVTSLLNSERHAHHLRALRVDTHLKYSARRHDAAMANADTMAHQVRGESALGRRMDRAGYHWTWNGENIAFSSRMTTAGVLALQKAMYGERPPLDGHRRNILSSHFRQVGVDVYLDRAHHRVWLTVDFGSK